MYQHCSSDDQSSKSLLRPAFSLDCVRSKCVYASDLALFFNHGKSLRNQRGRAALPCRAVHLPCFDKPSVITSINQICTGMGKSCYRTSDSASCFPYIRDVRLVLNMQLLPSLSVFSRCRNCRVTATRPLCVSRGLVLNAASQFRRGRSLSVSTARTYSLGNNDKKLKSMNF